MAKSKNDTILYGRLQEKSTTLMEIVYTRLL